jgi:hypothetical protein
MIRYVPSSQAQPLSDALWNLTRPPQVRAPQDTTSLFPWIDDLQTPSKRWLVVDTTFTIRVHAEAELDGIANILQPWIDEGYLPTDTNTTLAAFVESKRGQMLTVYDAFPQLFKDLSKTREEMIDAGWLVQSNINS